MPSISHVTFTLGIHNIITYPGNAAGSWRRLPITKTRDYWVNHQGLAHHMDYVCPFFVECKRQIYSYGGFLKSSITAVFLEACLTILYRG